MTPTVCGQDCVFRHRVARPLLGPQDLNKLIFNVTHISAHSAAGKPIRTNPTELRDGGVLDCHLIFESCDLRIHLGRRSPVPGPRITLGNCNLPSSHEAALAAVQRATVATGRPGNSLAEHA